MQKARSAPALQGASGLRAPLAWDAWIRGLAKLPWEITNLSLCKTIIVFAMLVVEV